MYRASDVFNRPPAASNRPWPMDSPASGSSGKGKPAWPGPNPSNSRPPLQMNTGFRPPLSGKGQPPGNKGGNWQGGNESWSAGPAGGSWVARGPANVAPRPGYGPGPSQAIVNKLAPGKPQWPGGPYDRPAPPSPAPKAPVRPPGVGPVPLNQGQVNPWGVVEGRRKAQLPSWAPVTKQPVGSLAPVKAPTPTPNTVILIPTGKVQQGFERDVEERVRTVAIEYGFSVADEVRYVCIAERLNPTVKIFIDFPHLDAAKEFMTATDGKLWVGTDDHTLEFQGPSPAAAAIAEAAARKKEEGAPEEPDTSTDTLIVPGIASLGLSTEDIQTAFQAFGRVKSVKIPRNWAGQRKNVAYIQFESVSECVTALNRFKGAGQLIGTKKVYISFAQPENEMEQMHQSAAKIAEEEMIKENHEQALGGINGNMWAEYLQHCQS